MSYFSYHDHQHIAKRHAGSIEHDSELQLIYDKFYELHTALYSRLRDLNYDLHAGAGTATPISSFSVVNPNQTENLSLIYGRSREQALLVERLMGRERNAANSNVDICRHPVIELRLTPEHFVVELIVSPDAWWDQQNLVAKLGIARHRDTFRTLLQRLDGDFCIGFWSGEGLSDMHVTTRQLARGNYANEWMSTFGDGQDWLRVGMWYPPEAPELSARNILRELLTRVGGLYSIYNFLLWTSNNDFHAFYNRFGMRTPNMHLS
ncbi:MAG: hypothetical protein DIU68_001595 [Chloroflexota bacterium]|nr:MAG: hypothetical protein DIU68_01660 [Chloroflexota bacterium]